jgi:hypothetical protein
MTQHDDSANQAHDDAASAEGHTMTTYIAWHRDNCRCEPADTNDAHDADTAQDAATDAAETRRDNQENEK